MKRTAGESDEAQPDSKRNNSEVEVWVRRTHQTDEEALLVRVQKSGLVAHLYHAISSSFSIPQGTFVVFLNGVRLSTRSSLSSLNLEGTFVLDGNLQEEPNEEEQVVEQAEISIDECEEGDDSLRKLEKQLFRESRTLQPRTTRIVYRCVGDRETKELNISLGLSFVELKGLLLQKERQKLDGSVVVDLHLYQHPLVRRKKLDSVHLEAYGFSEEEICSLPKDQPFFYVNFRFETADFKVSKDWGQFSLTLSWQPFIRQTDTGLQLFLTALYVIVNSLRKDQSKAGRFLGYLYHLSRFPPAILTLKYLIENKKIYAENKSALSAAFYFIFRQLVPRGVLGEDSKVFEYCLPCFGILIRDASPELSIDQSCFKTRALTCPLTFSTLVDPVKIMGSKRNDVYNRRSVLDRLVGGPLYMPGTAWDAISREDLISDPGTKIMLLSHPLSDDIICLSEIEGFDLTEAPAIYNNVLDVSQWTKTTLKIDTVVNEIVVVPTLSLVSSAVPSLTKDGSGKICVYNGPEACSVGTIILYDPTTGNTSSVKPEMLAKDLGKRGHSVDNREVKEAIVVCLDVSGSMADCSFNSKDEGPEETVQLQLTPQEVVKNLRDLEDSDCLPIYKRLYKLYPEELLEELSKEGMVLKYLCEKHLVELSHVLMDPFLACVDDLRHDRWPPSTNYLQSIPFAVLDIIYQYVLVAESMPDNNFHLPPPRNPINIEVRNFRGESKILTVDPSFSVYQIKRAFEPDNPKPALRLVHNRMILEDERKLSFYKIADGDVLHSFVPPGIDGDSDEDGSAEMSEEDESDSDERSIVIRTPDDTPHTLQVNISHTIQYLRYQIWYELGLKPSECSLWQGFRDEGGWAMPDYVDESLFIADLFESSAKIRLGPRDQKKVDPRLTRLETVQQLFHAFINRSQAYDYPNHIGLILFNTKAFETCKLTPLYEVFRDHIDKAYAAGGTNLYGAINKASASLVDFKITHPTSRLRIMVLSDGEDTMAAVDPVAVTKMLQVNGIVLDAIMVGEGSDNKILRAMSKATGGYAFAPSTLTEGLKLNELETLLSVCERAENEVDITRPLDLTHYADLSLYPLDLCLDDEVPKRKLPKALEEPTLPLHLALKRATSEEVDSPMLIETYEDGLEKETEEHKDSKDAQQQAQQISKNRTRRILRELTNLQRTPHPRFDIYPNEKEFSFWKLVLDIDEDEGSPYSGGTWLLYVQFPPEYPMYAPEIRFHTPIRHGNVNQYGKICHSIFTRNWTADTSMQTVLQCVYGLMLNPDIEDPLDTHLAFSFFAATGGYEAEIIQHVHHHAKEKNRDAWRLELAGEQ